MHAASQRREAHINEIYYYGMVNIGKRMVYMSFPSHEPCSYIINVIAFAYRSDLTVCVFVYVLLGSASCAAAPRFL